MVEIIPAILPKSLEGLEQKLPKLLGVAPLVQIDLVGTNILVGQEALPLWEELDFEIDIMLPNPEQEVRTCLDIGASRIVVHAAAPGAAEAIQMLQETRGGNYPVLVGVALGVEESPEALVPFSGMYDYVQVMGIAHIGKQGEPFDDRSLALLRALRAAHPELVLQVDGAAATHPRELVEAGANRLVVGSAIINAEDPQAVYKELYTKANAF